MTHIDDGSQSDGSEGHHSDYSSSGEDSDTHTRLPPIHTRKRQDDAKDDDHDKTETRLPARLTIKLFFGY